MDKIDIVAFTDVFGERICLVMVQAVPAHMGDFLLAFKANNVAAQAAQSVPEAVFVTFFVE